MQAGNGDGVQETELVAEGCDRQFSRQRRETLHALHLDEGIKTSLDDFFRRPLDELPGEQAEAKYHITGVDVRIRAVAKGNEPKDCTLQAGFLLHFTHDGCLGRFPALDEPAWEGPIAAVWLLIALDEEDGALASAIGIHHDPPDPQGILAKVDKAATLSFKRAARTFASLNDA